MENTPLKLVLLDFKEKCISINDLSIKYNLNSKIIKAFLKNELGSDYIKQTKIIAGTYGSRAFLKRLDGNLNFRKAYSQKMSFSVKKTINFKMKDAIYKTKWLEKTNKASKLGHKKVRYLLENDSNFRKAWIKNCKLGGKNTYENGKGVYDPENRSKRLIGSMIGLKNMSRKSIGPLGERMYNQHEVNVAKKLSNLILTYKYEKVFHINNQNGWFSCDFFIELNKPLIIEATYWDKVSEKCKRFNKKYNFLKQIFPKGFNFIIVVNSLTLKEKYSEELPSFNVCTTGEIFECLKKVAGVGLSGKRPIRFRSF